MLMLYFLCDEKIDRLKLAYKSHSMRFNWQAVGKSNIMRYFLVGRAVGGLDVIPFTFFLNRWQNNIYQLRIILTVLLHVA